MKKTNLFKSGVFLILVVILLTGMFPCKAFAQTEITASFFGNHADSDNNKENGYFCKTITIKNKYHNRSVSNYAAAPHGAGGRIQLFFVVFDGVIHPAYCIEPGAPVNGSWVYSGSNGTESTDPYWEYIRTNHKEVAEAISLTIGYANQYSKATDFSGARGACQLIIWEIMGGYRDALTGEVTDTSLRDATAGSRFEKYYELISNQLISHNIHPNFVNPDKNAALTITLSYDEEKKEWGKNITTTVGTVDMLDYTALTTQNISVKKLNDTTIYISTQNKIPSAQTYTVCKNLPESLYADNMYIWTSYTGGERGQCIVSGTNNTRVPYYIKLYTEPVYCNIEINYYDKYTNEVIHTQYKSTDRELNSSYDETERIYGTIGFDDKTYYYSSTSGDPEKGTLNTDKVINIYYGYDHKVTVNNFDKYTNEKIADSFVASSAEHLSEYDVTESILPEIEYEGIFYNHYPELNSGDSFTGVLDNDKTINLFYGYTHTITVNYYDKYTNQKISDSYSSGQTEHNSNYDMTEYTAVTFTGYDFIDRIEGDSITGTLDRDKIIDIYYGYNHNITIEYRDEDTGEIISETKTYTPENEHNTDYDKTSDTELEIEGYTKTKVTGDTDTGTLDCNKTILVWYKKNSRETVPETSDSMTSASLSSLIVGAACILTLFRKSKKDL